MVNQVLLELLGELGAEDLQIFSLFASFLIDLDNLFVDVSAEEVSSLGRILLSLLDFLQNLADIAVLALLDGCDLIHHILEQVLHQLLRLLITVHALINLHSDHLAELVRNLELTALKAIDLVLDSIVNLGNFGAQNDFLLSSGHLFLPDPAIDAPNLGFQV